MIGLLAWEPGREGKAGRGRGGGTELSGEGDEDEEEDASRNVALFRVHVCMMAKMHVNMRLERTLCNTFIQD